MNRSTYIDSDGMKLTVERWGYGSIEYYNSKDQYHRLDGPALVEPDGSTGWFLNGLPHRLDGPAAEEINGKKEWYVDGKEVSPLFLVAYWLERGRCCWFDETTNELRFGDG